MSRKARKTESRQAKTATAESPTVTIRQSAPESPVVLRSLAVAIEQQPPESQIPAVADPATGAESLSVIRTNSLVEDFKPALLRPYQQRWVWDPARFAIAVKSAQIGYSTATAAWAVDRCLQIPRRNVIFLSRSERQALELGEKAKMWVDSITGAAAEWSPNRAFGGTSTLQHEIRFGNGSRIIVLAANPDTARGYTGDVVLDEFAFHKDSQAIFTAVYRQVSLGFAMRILSTPNGQQGKFYELAKQLGLDSGVRPAAQPVRQKSEVRSQKIGSSGDRVIEGGNSQGEAGNTKGAADSLQSSDHPITRSLNPWSGHWCDIFMAVEDGLPLNAEEVRAGCDDDTWLQEYCCQFISQASEWISPELFQGCVSTEASTVLGTGDERRETGGGLGSGSSLVSGLSSLYGGWDIARNRDLSVIWINELVGDVTWTRGVVEMKNTPTPDQIREARSLMPHLRRLVIDKGGMGLVIFEALEREFPGQVEGIQFTQQKKETMAVTAKRRMEELKVRLPDSNAIRQSFRSVKKSVNALGLTRFDAEHDARFGHADHWWAFCLAEAAADRPTYHLAEVGKLFGQGVITRTENWTF
jgi:phage FluMu gp28-like protein